MLFEEDDSTSVMLMVIGQLACLRTKSIPPSNRNSTLTGTMPVGPVLVSFLERVMNQKYRVLGAHTNRSFFEIEVDAMDGLSAFGAAALKLLEADEEDDAEFFAAIPAGVSFELPGEGVVTLETVLDPEQAEVFGLAQTG